MTKTSFSPSFFLFFCLFAGIKVIFNLTRIYCIPHTSMRAPHYMCCSFFSHFLAVIYVIIVTVQYSARNTCWGQDFSAQASKELAFSARIALVLRVISACQTYLSKISTSSVRSKLHKQGFISNIQFCQVWKWYILRTALSIIKIFYWHIFFSLPAVSRKPVLCNDDITHINNFLLTFTSEPVVILEQRT